MGGHSTWIAFQAGVYSVLNYGFWSDILLLLLDVQSVFTKLYFILLFISHHSQPASY